MANTAKYLLKSDRTKSVDVIVPMFAMATIVGKDGKKTEMSRAEFDGLYEPALPKATLNEGARGPDVTGSQAAEQLEKVFGYLTHLGGRLDEVAQKVDAIHKVVAPKESNGQED